MKIPVANPHLSPGIATYVTDAVERGELSGNFGKYITALEEEFSRFCGVGSSVAVCNGTAALHVALEALGIGYGDEVIVQTLTNMASAFAVSYTGATPVPIDIEADTWNIDPELIEGLITDKTKAIIVVHLFGHPVDMDRVNVIAKRHGLYVIEDCAEAHGATYKGRRVGSIGDMGCFSFYANKIVAGGEGGIVTTNSALIAERVRSLRSLGYGRGEKKFMHEYIGFNYRMTNISAAITYAQLEDVEFVIRRKREIAAFYTASLAEMRELQLPVERDYGFNVYWMYHVVLQDKAEGRRDIVMKRMLRRGVETRTSFIPLNQQEVYMNSRSYCQGSCPVANRVGANGLYLPSGPILSDEEQIYIVNSLKEALND